MKCTECKTMADCKAAFGAWWAWKSSNGTGCNNQYSYAPTRTVKPTHAPITTQTSFMKDIK